MNDNSKWGLVFIPAVITLLVTLLRLIGELQGWSEMFFGTAAGGGMAIVGIVWLVPIFGVYFGWKLAGMGEEPSSMGKAALLALAGIGIVFVTVVVAARTPPILMLVIISVGALAGVYIARLGWNALADTLVQYGLLARIPVIVVMFLAFWGKWGTHYDAVPPDFPRLSFWQNFFFLGVMPQLTIWIFFTVAVGILFGLLGAAVAGRRHVPASAQG